MNLIPEPSPDLVAAIQSRRAVAVVGSGLSSAAGAPSWRDLLLGIVAEADRTHPQARSRLAHVIRAMDGGRYLDAASILKQIIGPPFSKVVARQLQLRWQLAIDAQAVADAIANATAGKPVASLFAKRDGPVKLALVPTTSHRLLTHLGFRVVVTTNYDHLLEQAWPSQPAAIYSWSYGHLARRVQDDTPFILKIHGDLHSPEEMILAREDYNLSIFSQARAVLRSLFATSDLFWIGYGHNDPDLDLLLDECVQAMGARGGYAVVLHDDLVTMTRLENARIAPIVLRSYADIPVFLHRLAELVGTRTDFGESASAASELRPEPAKAPPKFTAPPDSVRPRSESWRPSITIELRRCGFRKLWPLSFQKLWPVEVDVDLDQAPRANHARDG